MGKQKRSENTYQKIQTVFKRDEKNVIMPFAELTQPEFDFLRDKRYSEPTECRVYGKGRKKTTAEAFYPILDWTDNDVVDFIEERGIKVHPLYYREDGTIDPKRRLGCMCCPLAYYKKRIDYFKRYPNMVKAYCRAAQKFIDTHPDNETVQKYGDVFEWFTREVFFERQGYWEDHKTVTQFAPPITGSFWSGTSASHLI